MKFDSSPPSDASVAQGLASLKREGGAVLVVGAASGAQRDVCDRFLEGEDSRVFVDTDRPVRDDEPEAAEVIERPFTTRNSAAATSRPTTGITALAADLETAIRERSEDTGTLRVCFDSLRPFVDATDVPTLASALSSVRNTARDTEAVAHFHLPAMPEAVPRTLFEPVDAVVEVRHRNGTTYQRWRIPTDAEVTDWVSV